MFLVHILVLQKHCYLSDIRLKPMLGAFIVSLIVNRQCGSMSAVLKFCMFSFFEWLAFYVPKSNFGRLLESILTHRSYIANG